MPSRIAGLLAFLVSAAVLPLPAAADDTSLFTTSVAPNVVLMFDNSGSMNNVVWHPAFRPDMVYDPVGCPYIEDSSDPDYDPRCLEHPLCNITTSDTDLSSGTGNGWLTIPGEIWYQTRNGKTATRCENTREIFVDTKVKTDGNVSAWELTYLNWYFSENVEEDHDGDGRTILAEILDTDDGVNSACLVGLGFPTNYAKYRRARVTAAKNITRDVICRTNQIAAIRYGVAKFYSDSDPDGGYVTVAVDDYSASHATDLENGIEAIEGDLYTPLAETLYNVYRYFMPRSSSGTALGKDGSTRFPVYNIRESGAISTSSIPPSPVTDDCQKQFVVILTDGEPLRDDFVSFSGTSQETFKEDLIGDYLNPGDEVEDASGEGRYLDDVAAYMQAVDFYPGSTFPGKQTIDVYTVGFTTTPAANSLLERTAEAGNGIFFFSNNAEELAAALTAALADIVVKAKSFTAATVPASRATDGNNFFTTYFNPANDDPYWPGHLKTFEFNAAGEIRDRPTAAQAAANQQGDCALLDPVPGRCLAGNLDLAREGYWDAANEIPDATARDLYVSRYQSGPPSTIPATPSAFDESTVTASDLGVASGDIADYSGVGNGTSGITTGEELADAIVRYVRGCEFGSGTCVDRGDGNKLWDIFHSNPVVVGPPNLGLREQSYREFVSRYKHRKRVIYAGSNGGFLHGFNAGEYGTTAVPGGYDRGTGEEEMGFMAYPARRNIAELPLDTPPRGSATWNGYTMDGSAVASDVWLYPASNLNPDDVSSDAWNQWRSVVIGGMRQGGDVVFALDVTNPPDHNSSSGEQASGPAYPSYLWEFPCEDATDAQCTGSSLPTGQVLADYMGETWSEPVITRVRVRLADTCTPSPCPVYDRWVAIFGAGYHETGDPNHPDYDATFADATSRKGRAIFMVDVTTGEVLGMRRFDNVATDGNQTMRFAFAASPAVFDLNFDGYADVAYFADLGGNLWKWVISDDTIDPINGSGGDEEHRWDGTDGWKFLKIFTASSCGAIEGCTGVSPAPPPHWRSFYFPPAGALVGSELWLVIGSGERNKLDFESTLDAEKNRLYVFKDQDPLEREVALPSTGLPRYNDASAGTDFVDAATLTGSCTPPPPPAVGFYIEGEHDEKFITNSEIFFGTVLTSSYKPTAAADACSSGGQAFLYGFDLFCAEGALPDPGGSGSDVRRVEIGVGLPNRPRVSVGPVDDGGGGGGGPCQDRVVVITSDGEAFTECPGGRPDSGVHMNSWRDRN